MANKVKSLLGGPGFYAVLALCVLAVGVGGYFLLFGEPAQTEAPTGPDTAASAPVEDLPEHEPVVETVPPEEPEEEPYVEIPVYSDAEKKAELEAREKLEKQMEEYRRQAELRGTPECKAKNWMGSMLFHLSHANDVDQAWASSRTREELDQVVEPFVQAKRQTGQWTQEDEAGYQLYQQETDPRKRTFRVWYLIANPRGLPKEFVQKELEFRWKLFPEKKEENK